MLSLHDHPSFLCDGISRREMIRVGGLSLLGLGLPELLRASETAPLGVPPADKTFGRAKNIIYLWLAGGPPQHETFDPKPGAPAEIRGPFQPIHTTVPGIDFCELLPRTAGLAHQLAVVRSIHTDNDVHSASGYWVWTGNKYTGPNARKIETTDSPYFGSAIKRYKPSEKMPPLSVVWLPDWGRLNENVKQAGQTGGSMGSQWDPDRFIGNPNDPNYEPQGLRLTDLPPMRLAKRKKLLGQFEQHFDALERGDILRNFDRYQQRAFDLLTTGKAKDAFAIDKEPARIRDRYGRTRFGQCALLARRLIEAGVRLVHVQWPREPGDNAVDNPLWDTHAQNAERMEDVLAPTFDVGFSALLEDLSERGLLDETLVVAIGEFGRTPKINPKGGRDHWGRVWSFALAGAGIAGGQVYGSSDKTGGHPKDKGFTPGDLTATMFHLLGIDWRATFPDRQGQPHKLTTGEPIYDLLGTEPATKQRRETTGDIARVPPFDESAHLAATGFGPAISVLPAKKGGRPRTWRASPLLDPEKVGEFGVQIDGKTAAIGIADGDIAVKIEPGAKAILAQEVRSPFAGTYEATAIVRLRASSPEWAKKFLDQFECKLSLFRFTDKAKSALQRKDWKAVDVKPALDGKETKVTLSHEFVNPTPGSNFSFGLGLGVAVVVEKKPGTLELPSGEKRGVELLVDRIEIRFQPKPRNDKVII